MSVTAALHKAFCWLQSQQSTAFARADPAWSSSKEQMWVPGLCSTSGTTSADTGSSELPCFPGWTSRHAAWSRMRRCVCGELTHRFPSGLWGAPGLVTSHSAAPCPHRWVRRAAGCSGVQWGAAVPVWQESPVQPGGQEQRPGKAQWPPFWHGTWQRAAREIRNSVTARAGGPEPPPLPPKVCVHAAAPAAQAASGLGNVWC